ncbi:hypothetical protein OESDEN_14107 [Oesophagostomum dentatum]|uniref:Uncharacterized protein n=1 Tax=Oesophagostomum dentatum TaxID=61180 RepID=A0A0B1SQL6_OESDE|nr:hypothetical protein OESDEN_14107 [Oesophagostomum dentatum]
MDTYGASVVSVLGPGGVMITWFAAPFSSYRFHSQLRWSDGVNFAELKTFLTLSKFFLVLSVALH